MYNEDRDYILLQLLDIIEKKIDEKYNISLNELEELWDDEFWLSIESVFEPYSLGWRNYN